MTWRQWKCASLAALVVCSACAREMLDLGGGAPGGNGDYAVSVTATGNGTGQVVSDPAGIACPPTCAWTWDDGQAVQLSVSSVDPGSRFTGWGGACAASTTTTCDLVVHSDLFAAFEVLLTGSPSWVITAGDAGNDEALGIDVLGPEIAVTGQYENDVDFGSGTVVSGWGNQDIFLARYDSTGHIIAANGWGSQADDRGYGVTLADATVTLTGMCSGTIDFGNGGNNYGGGEDVCVATFDRGTNGYVWDWGADGGSNRDDEGRSITSDSTGALIGVGSAAIPSGGFFGGGSTLEVGIVRFDRNSGQNLDVWLSGGQQDREGRAIVSDGAGQAFVGGLFTGQIDFGGISIPTQGGEDGFIACIDENSGDDVWPSAVSFGGGGNDVVNALALAGNGAVGAGSFTGNNADIGGTSFDSAGGDDVFVVGIDETAQVTFVRAFGGTGDDVARGIAVDPTNGDITVVGEFEATIDFDGIQLTAQGRDAFVLRLDSTGKVIWARGYGGPGNDRFDAVAQADGLAVYVAGAFSDTVDFGDKAYTSAGGTDMVLMRLAP